MRARLCGAPLPVRRKVTTALQRPAGEGGREFSHRIRAGPWRCVSLDLAPTAAALILVPTGARLQIAGNKREMGWTASRQT